MGMGLGPQRRGVCKFTVSLRGHTRPPGLIDTAIYAEVGLMASLRALLDRVLNCAGLADASTGPDRAQHLLSLWSACDEFCKRIDREKKRDKPH
jgi:hypothetical protein